MGSEQSQPQNVNTVNTLPRQSNSGGPPLQRGNTIATSGINSAHIHDSASSFNSNSRPVSPPISVCSDSDLPYISYTDRPIGDSPKLRNNKGSQSANRNSRINSNLSKKQNSFKNKTNKTSSAAHSLVVVNAAAKEIPIELNEDLLRLKSIPMFLPVMRGTLSLPANRDPEVLERLQPIHLKNMCSTMQTNYNSNAKRVAADQGQLTAKVKEVDYEITRLVGMVIEKQKLYATYAEPFSKLRNISQQLTRCNTLLNQNIESIQQLNLFLDVEDRLEPFIWKTST